MKVQTAFYLRVSNKTLLGDASTMLYGDPRKLRHHSKIVSDRAITLSGHVIRANDDQMKMIAIDAENKRVEGWKRKLGTPRFFWLQTTMARAHRFRHSEQTTGRTRGKRCLESKIPFWQENKNTETRASTLLRKTRTRWETYQGKIRRYSRAEIKEGGDRDRRSRGYTRKRGARGAERRQ